MVRAGRRFLDIPFEELVVGARSRTEFVVDHELVRSVERLVSGGAPAAGPPGVHPAVYCTFLPLFHAMGGRMEQGTVHVGQRLRVLGPVPVGSTLGVEVTIAEARLDARGRRRVVLDAVYRLAGAVVCTSTGTYLWGHAKP